jgi:transcriptional regulator with XRE-family HTH domain
MKKAAKKAVKKAAKTTQRAEKPVSGKLRKALIDAIEANQRTGEKNSELSRRSGVSQPQITRFLSGERDISLEVAEKLCAALGLELRRIDKSAD